MRFHACLVAFVFLACAPSVPRPMREPLVPDAAVDLPPTPPSVTVDARPDVRQPVEPAADARSEVGGDATHDAAMKADTGLKPDALASDVPGADAKPET